MHGPTEDDYKHWGMACFCFSLDLARELTTLVVPTAQPEEVRQACRTAILNNRDHIAQTGRPAYLRDLVAQAWRGDGHAGFDDHVERVFVSPARRARLDWPLLRPLSDTQRLAALDAALADELGGTGYAAAVYSLIPQEDAKALFDMVMAVDSAVDGQSLTSWDHELIARNSEIHSPESPLALIIHGQMRQMEAEAANAVYAGLSDPARRAVASACEGAVHAAG